MRVTEIEENNKDIIQITKSYKTHIGNCLDDINPILDNIKNSNHTNTKLNNF